MLCKLGGSSPILSVASLQPQGAQLFLLVEAVWRCEWELWLPSFWALLTQRRWGKSCLTGCQLSPFPWLWHKPKTWNSLEFCGCCWAQQPLWHRAVLPSAAHPEQMCTLPLHHAFPFSASSALLCWTVLCCSSCWAQAPQCWLIHCLQQDSVGLYLLVPCLLMLWELWHLVHDMKALWVWHSETQSSCPGRHLGRVTWRIL